MTSRERVLAAFRHEEPDRVPRWCGASPEFIDSAKHTRQATKLLALAPDGIHLATAMGVQAAVYHVGLPAALLGYAFTEWKASREGHGHSPGAALFAAENTCLMEFVRKILNDSFGDFANASCA